MTALDLSELTPSITWAQDHIEVIDQTRLPGELIVRRLLTVEDVVDAIRRLVIRGAPAIGCCGAFGMVLGLAQEGLDSADEARQLLGRLTEEIGAARPTAVNLSWALNRVRSSAEAASDPADIHRRALVEAQAILSEDREACGRIGEHGRRELAQATRLLTHCNTGRLATGGWGTALGVIYAKAAAEEPVEVFTTETRPLLQGARLTAWELQEAGIPVTVLPDAAAGSLIATHGVDAVIVGADRIARNGDVANKVGTFQLALAAREAALPFYVAAPMSTFDREVASGAEIVIEMRGSSEVLSWQGTRSVPHGVAAWNPAFDITPHDLVTAFISDRGVLRPPFAESWASAAEIHER